MMAAFFVYGRQSAEVFISTTEASTCVFLLIYLYGAASIPLSYIYSFFFENYSTAQISIMAINFVTGFVAVLAYFIMESIPDEVELGNQLVNLFRVFPPYLIGEGFINLSSEFFVNLLSPRKTNYLSWKVCGRPIAFMACEAVGYFSIVLISELPVVRRFGFWLDKQRANLVGTSPPAMHEDEDVAAERIALLDADPKDYALLIRGLVKVYPPSVFCSAAKHAVRGVSFACKTGERFG